MNRRGFLRFLGVSPSLSVVDVTKILSNRPRLNMNMGLLEFTRTFLPDEYSRMTWTQKITMEMLEDRLKKLTKYSDPPQILDGT